MSRIHPLEPWFFLLFGAFHLHRVWALADRAGYAAFWMGLLEQKGPLYFLLMGALALLCLWGAALFFRERRQPRWWRWAYVLGGGYVLFDLAAIAAGWPPWRRLLQAMFDIRAPGWVTLWSAFVLLGGGSFALGLWLIRRRRKESP